MSTNSHGKGSAALLGNGLSGTGAMYNLRVYEQSPDSQNSLGALGGSWTRLLPESDAEQQDQQRNDVRTATDHTNRAKNNKAAKLLEGPAIQGQPARTTGHGHKYASQPVASAQADGQQETSWPAQLGNAQLIQNLTSAGGPEFVVSHLRPGSVYLLLLAAYNRRGTSQIKSFSISTLPLVQAPSIGKHHFGLLSSSLHSTCP
jgi:hypothetical protein